MIGLRARLNSRRGGAALLIAMWALFVLAGAVLVWASYVRHTLSVSSQTYNDTEARAMAHSGVAVAMHPLVTEQTPALSMESGNDPGFRVQMVAEGGKLNVNFLLTGEDPRKLDILKRWLEYRGIEFQDRERMVDGMLDWIDADNTARPHGQEDQLGYHPPNRGVFLTMDEITQVAGTEPLTSQPGWQDELTVWSAGPIDLTHADANVLRCLPGTNDAGIAKFLQWRRGPDGVDGTQDDPQIQKLEQVQGFFGLSKVQWNALGGLIMLRDNNWQIISDGWSGKVVRQVRVVVRKGSQNPTITNWQE